MVSRPAKILASLNCLWSRAGVNPWPLLLVFGFCLSLVSLVLGVVSDSFEPSFDSKYEKSCISSGCHEVPLSAAIPRHTPFLEGDCLACHTDHSSSAEGFLKPAGNGMCLPCHGSIETQEGNTELAHPADGKTCLDCHNPHESRVRNLARSEEVLFACANCHEDFLKESAEQPHQHQYFDPQRECGSCHYAHQNSAGKYLRPEVTETCLTCHDMPIVIDGRTLENVGREIREAPYVHGALLHDEGVCPKCHTPHGSPQPALLREGYPAGNYESYGAERYAVCWQCHDQAIVESPVSAKTTGFRTEEKNLHRLHVMQLGRGRACHVCHAAHAGDTPHLLRKAIRFNQWESPLGHEETTNGGTCTTPCHQEKSYQR